MTYFVCITEGQADCHPISQDYHACASPEELDEVVRLACAAFDWQEDKQGEATPYKYAFTMPREGEDNYSQRLRISKGPDYVLDVTGMTEADYERESA